MALNLKITQLYTRGCIIMNCKSKYFLRNKQKKMAFY